MDWLWIPGILAASVLMFLWPLHMGPMLPLHTPVDLWFKEGETRQVQNFRPGSEGYRKIMSLMDNAVFRRTPAGIFGDGTHDPACPRMTLICGDCAITVRSDGTVSVDGRAYTMAFQRSRTLVEAVRQIVTENENPVQ